MLTKIIKSRIFGEALWIGAGHSVGAIATLVGVRILTEFAQPSLYGTFVLANGGLSLLQGLALQPLAQAALRFYPDYSVIGAEYVLRQNIVNSYLSRWGWCTLGFICAAVLDFAVFNFIGFSTWLILAFAFGLEAWNTVEIVMRNASCQQMGYGILVAANSISRPAGAIIFALAIGPSLETLLFGQTCGILVILTIASLISLKKPYSNDSFKSNSKQVIELEHKMKRFAAPLIWAPLVAWVSNLADRYIVGYVLGLSQAGVYAAAYGLASRPMLMVGTISEATLRQELYSAVAVNNHHKTRKALMHWLGVCIFAGVAIVFFFWITSDTLVRWLLAMEYRSDGVKIIPWIAAGYLMVVVNQPLEKLLYSQQRTRLVTLIQSVSAGIAIVAGFVAAYFFGLFGVAVSVPVYFSIQLVITALMVSQTSRVK